MTIQVSSTRVARSKATLEAALAADPREVWFYDPSIFQGSRGTFSADEVKPGDRFPVVMDPATRQRFAEIVRKPDGSFKVR